MTSIFGPAMTGTLRYEATMAARRKVLWVATVPLVALSVLMAATSPSLVGLPQMSAQVGAWAVLVNLITTLGLAVALADRFSRARRRGLPELLDTTPAPAAVRMVGSLLGPLAVALLPVAVAMLAIGVAFGLSRSEPAGPAWALLAFLVVIVPGALVATTFAATLALVVPLALARIIVVGAWLWATVWNSSVIPLPSVSATVLSPLGDYAAHAWLQAPAVNKTSGATLLSPTSTFSSAAVSVAALLLLTTALLFVARALRERRD
jgi:ABC-2 type transport system permease protein